MRYLLWMAGLASVMAFVSVFAEAIDDEPAARVASRPINRLPASVGDIVVVPDSKDGGEDLPADLEGASIEVGFSQDNEPEPHLLAVASGGTVKLFQLEESQVSSGRAPASVANEPPAELPSRKMPSSAFIKRVHQAVGEENFFTARQPKPKRHCKDRYVLRVKVGKKFRERRGCTNQSDDPFAGLAQVFFRDAFIAWGKSQ